MIKGTCLCHLRASAFVLNVLLRDSSQIPFALLRELCYELILRPVSAIASYVFVPSLSLVRPCFQLRQPFYALHDDVTEGGRGTVELTQRKKVGASLNST
ncbi:hypothetical protein VNO78_03257 [Psophocarpus tetragonolobus]|uniref:Uncharacterized protein n=1 Tax=Psophocarpus tetragonolobus TaxID=3891 RepID=A0AAN9T097_PSOTE